VLALAQHASVFLVAELEEAIGGAARFPQQPRLASMAERHAPRAAAAAAHLEARALKPAAPALAALQRAP